MRAAWMALTGEDPELLGVLRAYPTGVGVAKTGTPQELRGAPVESA
jgi:hypothetical protein